MIKVTKERKLIVFELSKNCKCFIKFPHLSLSWLKGPTFTFLKDTVLLQRKDANHLLKTSAAYYCFQVLPSSYISKLFKSKEQNDKRAHSRDRKRKQKEENFCKLKTFISETQHVGFKSH